MCAGPGRVVFDKSQRITIETPSGEKLSLRQAVRRANKKKLQGEKVCTHSPNTGGEIRAASGPK